ncbi:MAG: FAD-dependent oxidoreductase [Deltaproteobacteria bacterium]|nr:FAD-dependent oxidoreductase [Deltaproteobacteria bacterium]MBI3294416.1 FAD-dependent oxidoreductase [Deltaproteobacteria bacterium]
MKRISRRLFLASMGAGAGALVLSNTRGVWRLPAGMKVPSDLSPIDRTNGLVAPQQFVGDDPHPAHKVLWDIEGFIKSSGGIPDPQETVDFAVVGGGMSGLVTAYLLRQHRPILFEQARRLGGNAKGASWGGNDYPMGAVYFTKPEKGGRIDRLLTEIGVDHSPKEMVEAVGVGGKLFTDFWKEGTTQSFSPLADLLEKVGNEKEGFVFPKIPGDLAPLNGLDRISLAQFFEKHLGKSWSRDARTWVEYYCWSSFGGGAREVSAAAGLNFLAGDAGGTCMVPGGNAGIAEKLYRAMDGQVRLRTESIVVRVELYKGGVRVAYVDREQKLRSVLARKVVVAAPKYVAKHIVADLSESQKAAMGEIKYRGYAIGTVCLKAQPPEGNYCDVYVLGDGVAVKPQGSRRGTDVVIANFASGFLGNTVLSVYRPLAFEGGRPKLLAQNAYSELRTEFEQQIQGEILPLFGYHKSQVADFRMNRWGHALPLAEVGAITSGRYERARQTVGGRILFANQDNWALPAFEVCVSEALSATEALLSRETA